MVSVRRNGNKTNINSLDASKNIGDMKVQNIKTDIHNIQNIKTDIHKERYPCIYGDCCIKMFYPKWKNPNSTMTRSSMLTKKCKTKEEYVKECEEKIDNFIEILQITSILTIYITERA